MKSQFNAVVLLGLILVASFAVPSFGQDGKSMQELRAELEDLAASFEKHADDLSKEMDLRMSFRTGEVEDIAIFLRLSDVQKFIELTNTQKQKVEETISKIDAAKKENKTKSVQRLYTFLKQKVLKKSQREGLLIYYSSWWMTQKKGNIETLIDSSLVLKELGIPKNKLPNKEILRKLKTQQDQELAAIRKKYQQKMLKVYPSKVSSFLKRLAENPGIANRRN